MSYVKSVLQPGERVIMQARLHWIVYWQAMVFFVFAIVAAVWGGTSGMGAMMWLVSAAMLVLFAVSFARAWFIRWITEIAVTDRRIIYKRGFIRRRTIEMHLDKVESVDVDQSILGRIFSYGDILVRGVGVGIEPLENISSPLTFRNHVTAEPLSGPSAPAKAE
jgi:uncharacterized membrane protein YdbT with pleckstrin-like domain